ncbi:MAG TPA: DUF3618 domain-containing protein [Candidatus Limnocylindrales bacterium]|nr:DUF3618 domain-containing protein [Candidatus Limnocylindrales bacterium]
MTYDSDPVAGDQPASTDESEERVERLTEEIDQTRDGLTETIQAIGDKLEPGNIAREATDTVVATTRGKVDQMTYGAQETFRDVTTNPGSIVDTIKSNPVPAGMVGLGIAMLFMNRGKQGQDQRFGSSPAGYRGYQSFDYGSSLPGDHGYRRQSSWEPQAWDQRSSGGSPVDRVGQTVSGAAGTAGETVSNVADEAGRRVGELADTVGQTAGELPEQAGYYVQQGTSQVRRFIDENPLGAGVIAVAAGAAVGMLLPSTQVERQTIGQARDQFVEQAESTVHQALDKVEDQAQQSQQQA